MKNRITYWQTTLPGIAVLLLLAYAIWIKPELLDNPASLVPLVTGLYGVLRQPPIAQEPAAQPPPDDEVQPHDE